MAGHDWETGVVHQNAVRAAEDPRTMAYVGDVASGATMGSMPVLGTAGIAQVAPGGTYTGLTRPEGAEDGEPFAFHGDHGRNLVRVIPADHLQAQAAVERMSALHVRRLAVVGDGETYTDGFARMVARRARSRGIEVVRARFDPHRLSTIRELAERVRRFRADALFFGGPWQNRGVALWGRVHRASPRTWLIGSDALADPLFTRSVLRSSRARTILFSPEVPPPAGFARRFRERFGHDPHPLAWFGHEAMRRALLAVAAANGSRLAVVNELFRAPGIDRHGDVTSGRFVRYRADREGRLRITEVVVVSAG